MADFRNNNVGRDSNDQHTLRVELCVAGMDKYGAELAFRGKLVEQMTKHREDWDAATQGLVDEWGDEVAATALVNKLETELHDMLVSARWMVESMLHEDDVQGVEEHDIRRDFGLNRSIPYSHPGQLALARQMTETNERYIAEGSPYALPEAPFNAMKEKNKNFRDAIEKRSDELGEALHAGKFKEFERAKGDTLLARAFKWICAVWDNNDTRLLEFGFVPKSQIWTPGGDKFPAPTKLIYDQFRNDFTWNPVEKATRYELEVKNKLTQEKITIKTELNQKRVPLEKGEYEAKVRAIKEASAEVASDWSDVLELSIAEAPGHFKYNPGQHEFSWDSVAGANMYELQKEGSFAAVYLGPDTEFVLELEPGQYKFRVRAGNEIEHWWGQWTEWLEIDV